MIPLDLWNTPASKTTPHTFIGLTLTTPTHELFIKKLEQTSHMLIIGFLFN